MTGSPITPGREHAMSMHTKVDIETVAYECAQHDCGHDVSPCPPTGAVEACRECTDRNWVENEGPVVWWDECGGTGASFAEVDAESTDPAPEECTTCKGGPVCYCTDTGFPVPLEPTEPSPTQSASLLERGSDTPSREHTNGSTT